MGRIAALAIVAALAGTAVAQPDLQPLPQEPAPPPVAPEPAANKKPKNKKVEISGYFQVWWRYSFYTSTDGAVDAPNFRVQRARINFKGKINKYISYKVEIDPRAPSITGVMRDCYFAIKKLIPHHQIRVGQQKTQFGYENPESSTRLWYVNRSEVADNLSRGVTLRDVGIGIIGDYPLGGGWFVEDAITGVNGNGMNTQIDDTRRRSYWGRVGGRYEQDQLMARVGLSAARGNFVEPFDPTAPTAPTPRVDFSRLGGDVEVDTPWAFVAAEYVWGRDTTGKDTPAEDTSDSHGYYVNLVGKAAAVLGPAYKTGPLFRYDKSDADWQRFTFGAYYGNVDDNFRVLLNYEYRRLKDSVRGDDRLYVWTQVTF